MAEAYRAGMRTSNRSAIPWRRISPENVVSGRWCSRTNGHAIKRRCIRYRSRWGCDSRDANVTACSGALGSPLCMDDRGRLDCGNHPDRTGHGRTPRSERRVARRRLYSAVARFMGARRAAPARRGSTACRGTPVNGVTFTQVAPAPRPPPGSAWAHFRRSVILAVRARAVGLCTLACGCITSERLPAEDVVSPEWMRFYQPDWSHHATTQRFIFATGIECSYPMIETAQGRRRIDQLEKC